ncbi:MAG TPA: glyoxalase, partial [Ktedonobacter sp.]|nr:glyoxalase [Ktedonobacter sp.]
MITKIEAQVLFVQDLTASTAFYRDTFKMNYLGSDANSSTFLLQEGLYFILLSPEGAADLLGMQVSDMKSGTGSRGLLA